MDFKSKEDLILIHLLPPDEHMTHDSSLIMKSMKKLKYCFFSVFSLQFQTQTSTTNDEDLSPKVFNL